MPQQTSEQATQPASTTTSQAFPFDDMSKACKRCERVMPMDEFYAHRAMSDGHLSFCKDCVKARIVAYRETHDSVREYDRRRSKNNPKRRAGAVRSAAKIRDRCPGLYAARSATQRAIKAGLLVRPDTCEQCLASGVAIEAAHHDYSKPLDVRWLCRRCHRRWDQTDPKTKRSTAA
jgi:hypothetical protein